MNRPPAASDTKHAVLAVHAHLVADLGPVRRAERVRDLTHSANRLALAGLAALYPDAPEAELLLRLAVRRLGADAVSHAYGWSEPRRGA